MLTNLPSSSDFASNIHGSASFMTQSEAIRHTLTIQGTGKKACPYLGTIGPFTDDLHRAYDVDNGEPWKLFARRTSSRQGYQDTELQDGIGHLLTIATSRAGKGTGQIIPNLLTWSGSVLVVDVKGENYFHSAGYRAHELNQNVFRFAPFEASTEIWNPIMGIRANLNWSESTHNERCQEEEDACYLTNLLISPSGSEQDEFWEAKAKCFLRGLVLHVRTAALTLENKDVNDPDLQHRVRERSMREVRRLLTLNEEDFLALLDEMSESKRNHIREPGSSFKGFLAGEGKTGQSIIAMLLKQTDVWSLERVHTATYKSSSDPDDKEPAPNDFTFSQMRDGNTTIYLIIPPEYLSEYRSVLRVMIGLAMRELKDSCKKSKKKPEYSDKPPVLFLLDEFSQLAYMAPIEEALSYIAGYGVRFWFFLQDISQLKLHYQKSWQTFIANTDIKCFYGVNDEETAKLLSEMVGTATVNTSSCSNGTSINNNLSYNLGWSANSSNTFSSTSRLLMTPDEVRRMYYNNKQIIFIKGLKPIYCDLPKFHQCPTLHSRSEMPPPKEIDF